MREARDARGAVDQARARCTSRVPARPARGRARSTPRARPSAPWSRHRPSAQPEPREELVDAALVGHEQEGDRAVLALDHQVRVEQQRDVAREGGVARTLATIAPSMSVAVAGGVGSSSMPVIEPSALMYDAPTMLPISPRAERANSSPGSRPSMRHMVSASAGGEQQHGAAHVALDAEHDAGHLLLASPTASTASANGSACAFGTEMSTDRPSIPDSAVAAVPEPMLASSRRASSWSSGVLGHGCSFLGAARR